MSHDQRTPNGGSTTGSPQGDGDNRPVKEASPDPQKALDATSAEPRDVPSDGHGAQDPGRERRD